MDYPFTIIKKGKYFVAKGANKTHKHFFQGPSWKYMPVMGGWFTSDLEAAFAFREVMDSKVREEVEKHFRTLRDALAASTATTSDLEVPVPPGLSYRPYQLAGIEFMLARKNTILADGMRLGKHAPVWSNVLTPTGWKRLGDVVEGDPIIGRDGKAYKVTGVYPQGMQKTYEIKTWDGATTWAGGEHLFSYITSKGNLKTVSVNDMLKNGLTAPCNPSRYKYTLPTVEPVDFKQNYQLVIDPYILGVLIGDGYLSGGSIGFSAGDNKTEIVDKVRSKLPPYLRLNRHDTGGCPQWMMVSVGKQSPIIKGNITALGLNVKSKDRRIPKSYLYASIENRKELLQGLMDTDGSCRGNRSTYHTCSGNLAVDVVELVRGLGGIASLRTYDRTKKGKPVEYQVRVNLDFCPFSLSYKASEWKKPTQKRGKSIVSIKEIGEDEHLCISTSAPDQLYVCDDYIVTHNTQQVIGLINALPKTKKVLILCPANAKIHWQRKLTEWLVNKKLTICVCRGVNREPADIYICNWEILKNHIDFFRETEWDVLAIDEAHSLQNPKSYRTQAILGAERGSPFKLKPTPIPYKKRVFITGTPIYTRPVGLWPILRAADPDGLGKDYHTFVHRYCDAHIPEGGYGLDVKGYSNSEELQLKMRKSVMIRREKKDIGADIQAFKDIHVFPQDGLEKLVRQERETYTKFHDRLADLLASELTEEVSEELIEHFGHLDGLDRALRDDEDGDFGDLMQISVRESLALAKIPMCVEFINETLESEPKVVVFAHHRSVVKALREAYPEAAYYYGGMTATHRQANIDKFQNDPNCRIFIGNILAAGQAIELSAADCIIFVETSWVPAEMDQAEDRVWLPTKMNAVSVYYLVVEGTVEETMMYALRMRRDKIRRALNKEALESFVNKKILEAL